MKRVTGIGGVFIKSKQPEVIKEWYKKHLGLDIQTWGGTSFKWSANNPENKGYTVWSVFNDESDYFDPSSDKYMINYVVEDLDALLVQLEAEGIKKIGEMSDAQFGKFAWIMDPEDRKIELWQPI